MSNHPQMSAALQNVSDLNDAYKNFRATRSAMFSKAEEKKAKKRDKKEKKKEKKKAKKKEKKKNCLLYTSPSPRDKRQSRMPSSA